VPDVPESVSAGDHRRAAARRRRQCTGEVADRARPARADVVGADALAVLFGRGHRGRRDVAHMHEVAPLPAVLEHLRRLTATQCGQEDGGDSGVRRVHRQTRSVHVVIPQRRNAAAGHPGPRRGQVLLPEFACGVGVARIHRRGLADQRGREPLAAQRAGWLEPTRRQIGFGARAGRHVTVRRAPAQSLAVDDHRAGQDEMPHVGASHRRE
jgi:hypothetical protein